MISYSPNWWSVTEGDWKRTPWPSTAAVVIARLAGECGLPRQGSD